MNTPVPGSPDRPAWARWLLIAVVAATVFLSAVSPVDRLAETQYNALFQRALVTL